MGVSMQTREKESRGSGIIIILILLLGFICIILASGWALRFAPSWKLNTNMGSNLNPNSDFLTSRPANFIEPIDPAILTQPAWINVFLTPGISLPTRTPLPTSTITSIPSTTSTPIIVPTQTIVPTSTLPPIIVVVPTNTKKSPPPPPPATDTSAPPSPPTSTNTSVPPPPSADLQITTTDNATEYAAGISVQYTIVVSNTGPNSVTGATVSDTFSANLTNVTWTCSGSGSCTAGGTGDISDSVNLPVGTSVTYTTVNATVINTPNGPLVNSATVSAGITDPIPGNNSATDTDLLASPFPAQITTSGDGSILNMSSSSFLDLQLASPLTLGPTSQIIYYPDPTAPPPPLQIDAVVLQIGDGKNWYPVLNWGDGAPNANTDIPAAPACVVSETDNCTIDPTLLTNSPGITINLSGLIPAGTYPYIRIISPGNPPDTAGDGVSIDAIVVVP
jgi:uncharacterized repeat protein (TIGR01451 family)